MKKALLFLALVISAVLGVSAYAEEAAYDKTTNTASAVKENVKTVLITNTETGIESGNIFYVDQAKTGSVLDAAAGFAMKANAPDGTYFMRLGYNELVSGSAAAETLSFTITTIAPDSAMGLLADSYAESADGKTFSVAFVTEDAIDPNDYATVKFGFTDAETTTYLGYPLADLLGTKMTLEDGAGIKLGVQLNDIPIEYKDNVSMMLSNDTLSEGGDEV